MTYLLLQVRLIQQADLIFTLAYVIPLLVCFAYYSYITWTEYRRDITVRENAEFYCPTLTIGNALLRLALCILPMVNLLAMIFDVLLVVILCEFRDFVRWLDTPIVPQKPMEPPKPKE